MIQNESIDNHTFVLFIYSIISIIIRYNYNRNKNAQHWDNMSTYINVKKYNLISKIFNKVLVVLFYYR